MEPLQTPTLPPSIQQVIEPPTSEPHSTLEDILPPEGSTPNSFQEAACLDDGSCVKKNVRPAQEFSPEDVMSIFESAPLTPTKVHSFLEENMENSGNKSKFVEMIGNLNQADLSKRTIRWMLEQVEKYYGQRCSDLEGQMDSQKLEKKTVLIGYVMLVIFKLKQNEPLEGQSDYEKYLLSLKDQEILKESIKIAAKLEKSIRKVDNAVEKTNIIAKESFFDRITKKLSESSERERVSIVTDLVKESEKVNLALEGLIKERREIDEKTNISSDEVQKMDEINALPQSDNVIQLPMKQQESQEGLVKTCEDFIEVKVSFSEERKEEDQFKTEKGDDFEKPLEEDKKDEKMEIFEAKLEIAAGELIEAPVVEQLVENPEKNEVPELIVRVEDPEQIPPSQESPANTLTEHERQILGSTADTSNTAMLQLDHIQVPGEALSPIFTLLEEHEQAFERDQNSSEIATQAQTNKSEIDQLDNLEIILPENTLDIEYFEAKPLSPEILSIQPQLEESLKAEKTDAEEAMPFVLLSQPKEERNEKEEKVNQKDLPVNEMNEEELKVQTIEKELEQNPESMTEQTDAAVTEAVMTENVVNEAVVNEATVTEAVVTEAET